MKTSVLETGVRSFRSPISLWYVYLPSDKDRDEYISNCIRTNTITVVNTNGEVRSKVKIGRLAMQVLQFPESSSSVGSPVVCANVENKSQLLVIEVYDFEDEFVLINENEFAVSRKTQSSSAELRVQGSKGIVLINVDSDNKEGGKLIINVANSENAGEVALEVDGSVSVKANGEIRNESNSNISSVVYNDVDSFDRLSINFNLTEFEVLRQTRSDAESDLRTLSSLTLNESRFAYQLFDEDEAIITSIVSNADATTISGATNVILGEGAESIVLGETLAQLLKDVLQEISISQTSVGPLLNAAKIAAFIKQVDTILSKYSKTD